VKSELIGIIIITAYGDWVPPPPHQRVDNSVVSAFSYIQGLEQVIELAQFLKDDYDYTRYKQLLDEARKDFNTAWFNRYDY